MGNGNGIPSAGFQFGMMGMCPPIMGPMAAATASAAALLSLQGGGIVAGGIIGPPCGADRDDAAAFVAFVARVAMVAVVVGGSGAAE